MFDPLHKWLGIPPDQQPPNHYRLLGIDLFESDADVIDAAADKQLTFLHQLTSDEHAEAAEEISNQVSIARLCLLNPAKKKAYDDSLNRNQQPAESPSAESPSGGETDAAIPIIDVSEPEKPVSVSRPRQNYRTKPKRKSPWSTVTAICGIVVLLTLVLGIQQGRLILDWSKFVPGQSASNQSVPTKAATPGRMVPPSPSPSPSPATRPQTTSSTAAAAAMQEHDASEIVQPEESVAPTPIQSSTDDSEPASQSTPAPKPTPKPRRSLADLLHDTNSEQEPGTETVADQPVQSAEKAPTPDKASLAEKMTLVRDLYRDQYVNAKSGEQRIELAKQMHRDGELTTDDPVGRFALWQVSRDIFAGQGRFNSAMAIADNFATFYDDVDAESLKLESLKEASAKVTPSSLGDFYETSIQFAQQCCDRNRHVVATDTIVFLLQTFGDRLDFSQVENAKAVRDRAVVEGQRHRDFKNAIMQLAEKPDSKANDTVGKYLAFVRGDWEEAIHYLAESANESLAAAAKTQLAFQTDEASPIDVASAWDDASEKIEAPEDRMQVVRHALTFYEMAAESSEGLLKRTAEVKIAKAKEWLGTQTDSETIDPAASEIEDASGEVLAYRVYQSSASKSDFAKHRRNKFTVGMGNRSGGIGEAAVGVELKSVKTIQVDGAASHEEMMVIDEFSKTGFLIDYRTPGGYTKRVFLGLGISPGRSFTDLPAWGTGGKPEIITDIGKSAEYEIDLTRWAPKTWDGRSWVTLYMQNAGEDRSIQADIKW
ncbi:hypothetical protein LF1_45180 [Rubripirellula obstinata]|uniref:J domain-containing protein n=1 Tax=Rubripirellula obstinata TaxID=406547 RepID=A0A5B1CL90_9BACT|nr:hypothetical protein [Rubripirellula obstinata]KAA1261957.1 hypothetical protein LF1_45180 [Rubripirellula obstinata]